MADLTRRFQLYSVKPIAPERRAFQLPRYPYTVEGMLQPLVEELFKAMGIVFFRDDQHGMGLLIQPDDTDPTPLYDRSGFVAWKSIGILDLQTLGMWHWKADSDPQYYRKLVAKHGDDYAWMVFNQEVRVLAIEERQVQVV